MTKKHGSKDETSSNAAKEGLNHSLSLHAFLSIPNNEDRMSISSHALSDVPSDIIIKSRIKYGSRWNACKGLLMEYSKSTTIHGIRYLFEVHRPIYEKIYWLVLLMTSLYFAVSLIRDTYVKWQDSPVILGFDETLVPVHQIPFPTITICPEIKFNQKVFDFADISKRLLDPTQPMDEQSREELAQMAAALHICEPDVAAKFAPLLKQFDDPMRTGDNLADVNMSKNDTLPFCKWKGRFFFCLDIFTLVATDEGICYQFNGMQSKDIYRNSSYLSFSDPDVVDFQNDYDELDKWNNITGNWSLDAGYIGQGNNAYPQRTIFSSIQKGLFAFLVGLGDNVETTCRHDKTGFKVFLNSPESVPQTTGNYILVSYWDEVIISVLPHYVISTDNLHDYEPSKRQCYFNDERYLRFFRHYSQSNCQTECLANFTIAKCGCAKFWMPKPEDVPVCGVADIECYTSAQTELNLILQNQTVQMQRNSSAQIMCDCMPACTSLSYNFEISRAFYDLNKTILALRDSFDIPNFLPSRLTVFFKERQFTAIKRTVLFSVTTLIANCGGIFGLFMGISSLSIIELGYFFSVRLYDNLHKRRVSKKKLLMEQDLATASPSLE